MKTWLAQPALHFAVLGALIWLSVQLWEDRQFRQIDAPTAAEVEQLQNRWRQQHGQNLDATLKAALLQAELDERMLFREALRRKLHLRDPVVLRRLRQDAEFLGLQGSGTELIQSALELELYHGDDVIRRRLLERMRTLATSAVPRPDEAALRLLHAARGSSLPSTTRYSFDHLFFRQDAQASRSGQQRASLALAQLQRGDDVPETDPFIRGQSFAGLTAADIDERFGRGFADLLTDLPLNRWQGPLASRYGWHLIRLQQRASEQAPGFEAQRQALSRQWLAQQQQQALAAYLQQLRPHYRIRK